MKNKSRKIIGHDFFDRSAVQVAPDLLGKYLVRKIGGKAMSFKIVETEAYEGPKDKASHANRGKTPRTSPMFESAGTMFVYFTYGMHWMFNIVCGKAGHPSAVLIRGVEGCTGPGRLTKKFEIDKKLNERKLSKKSGLWIEENTESKKKLKITKTPRVGVAYAGPVWSKKPYRFVLV